MLKTSYLSAAGEAVCFAAVASSQDVSIRFAVAGEEAIVSSVLLEAAEWLRQRGVPMWSSSELTAERVAADMGQRRFLLAFVGGDALGTACLMADDPQYWPEAVAGEAMYVHRLAVRRAVLAPASRRPCCTGAAPRLALWAASTSGSTVTRAGRACAECMRTLASSFTANGSSVPSRWRATSRLAEGMRTHP